MRGRVLEVLAGEGVLLEPAAASYIMKQEDPVAYAIEIISSLPQKPLVLTLQDLMTASGQGDFIAEEIFSEAAPVPPRKKEVKVLKDVTGVSCCEGNISDFARYFTDRFRTIKKMLARRRELVGAVPISRALKLSREVKIIAIVNDVRVTKNGHKMLEVEDEEEHCLALISRDSPLINESIVEDEVLGIIGKASSKGDIIVVDEIIRPDIPVTHTMRPSDSTSSVAFLSDIHVGSKTFLERQWLKMTSWLKKEWKKEGIEYLVIPGDIVDGIGVFPDQEEELSIDDIFLQYEKLSELLKEIPDGIQMIIQPGNHDAVRPAEPQPTFSKKITDLFDSSIIFVGNPCYLEIEGRTILSYHGRSMDDLISSIQSLNYETPIDAMKEMLKRRHLAPQYGGKTPIAPEKKDYLVIDIIPDIFVTGHVHGAGLSEYKGIRLINASTWQAQTAYQRMHNFVPDPAKMPVVHLGNGKSTIIDFNT